MYSKVIALVPRPRIARRECQALRADTSVELSIALVDWWINFGKGGECRERITVRSQQFLVFAAVEDV